MRFTAPKKFYELKPEFCMYSYQQSIRVYIRNFSEAKFADKNSGIRYFFWSILLKTKITQITIPKAHSIWIF